MGVAVHRRGLSAAARRGGAGRAVLRHRGRRDAAARPRGAARGAPLARPPPWARLRGRPRTARSAAARRPNRARSPRSSSRGPCHVPLDATSLEVYADQQRRHDADRAPGPDAAADRRRVGRDAGRRRDEPGRGCRGGPTSTARCCTSCSASGTRAAASRGGWPSWRTRCRRAFGRRVRPDLPADVVKAFAQAGIKVQSTRALGARGARPSGGEAAARVQEAVPDLDRARLVLAPGLGAGRPVPARVPARAARSPGAGTTNGGGALQIPKVIRRAVVADPGWRLVVADADQMEPRVLAAISRDPGLMEVAGRDERPLPGRSPTGPSPATAPRPSSPARRDVRPDLRRRPQEPGRAAPPLPARPWRTWTTRRGRARRAGWCGPGWAAPARRRPGAGRRRGGGHPAGRARDAGARPGRRASARPGYASAERPRPGPLHPQLRRPGQRRRLGAAAAGRAAAAPLRGHARPSWSSSSTTR